MVGFIGDIIIEANCAGITVTVEVPQGGEGRPGGFPGHAVTVTGIVPEATIPGTA